MKAQPIANVFRGGTVESIHRGHAIVIDGTGNTILSIGDPDTVTFFRSAAKPFQLIPFLTSGGADAFNYTAEQIAMAVASHSGEPKHVAHAAAMLEKAGFTESDLLCGVHLPFFEPEAHRMIADGETATQLHNNCSGKHAAMLAFARHIDALDGEYVSQDNRIQKRILRCVADFTEIPEAQIAIGIDGCAAPNFAVPLSAMAISFLHLVSPNKFPQITQEACRRIVSAMIDFPELIGGSERLDTILMKTAPAKIVSKVGADGVWLCGILPSEKFPNGAAIALKVEDGNDLRARPVAAVQLLRKMGILGRDELSDLSPMPIKNRRGDTVGSILATDELS